MSRRTLAEPIQRLTSASNPRIKSLVRLQKKASERRELGLFCVETVRILTRARSAGLRVHALYFDPLAFDAPALISALAADGVQIFEVTAGLLAKAAYRQNPEGFIAVVAGAPAELSALDALVDPLLVVCSGLEKPGNLGAILRSADGAGVDAVLLDQPVDLFNPNCVRASTGAVFSVPVVSASPAALQAWLKQRGVRMLAATPDAPGLYTEADLTGPLAIVMGSEAHGLAADWRAAANLPVRLPMHGLADSLNVSVAAAVLMYEAARQRA
jgi:TrmH family RNA methyltransferase